MFASVQFAQQLNTELIKSGGGIGPTKPGNPCRRVPIPTREREKDEESLELLYHKRTEKFFCYLTTCDPG